MINERIYIHGRWKAIKRRMKGHAMDVFDQVSAHWPRYHVIICKRCRLAVVPQQATKPFDETSPLYIQCWMLFLRERGPGVCPSGGTGPAKWAHPAYGRDDLWITIYRSPIQDDLRTERPTEGQSGLAGNFTTSVRINRKPDPFRNSETVGNAIGRRIISAVARDPHDQFTEGVGADISADTSAPMLHCWEFRRLG